MTLRPLILQPDAAPYGANRALLRAIRAMPLGSVRPLVVFPYAGDAIAEYEGAGCDTRVMNLAVLRRTSAGPTGIARLMRERRATGRALATLAAREGCDLVHTNSMTIVSGGPAAHGAGIPHVWQLRETPVERGLKARALGVLLSRADRVLAVSTQAAQLGPAGTQVIHDGYDLPVHDTGVQTPLARDGELLVGMIGRISPSKAPHVAVEALGAGMRLAIAGTVYPGYEQYAADDLFARARARGIASQVDTLGWLDDPAPLLRQLDVLVIATASGEGFPGSVLEALAHGVPVVSCATGGVDELVIDGVTGIACTPGDASAVARALEQLRDDPALRAQLGEAGRAFAQQFSVQASADALFTAWTSCLSPMV
jgi:glycosyltransferase involved in cell wall biosynthesis